MNPLVIVWAAAACIFALVPMVLFLLLFRPWLRALLSGSPVPLVHVIGMRLRGNPPLLLIDAYLVLAKSGEEISMDEVETTYMANKHRVKDLRELVDCLRDQRTDAVE